MILKKVFRKIRLETFGGMMKKAKKKNKLLSHVICIRLFTNFDKLSSQQYACLPEI